MLLFTNTSFYRVSKSENRFLIHELDGDHFYTSQLMFDSQTRKAVLEVCPCAPSSFLPEAETADLFRQVFVSLGAETLTVKPMVDSSRAEETVTRLQWASTLVPLGRYRHFKGNEYEVLAVAFHSETLEPMVVYRALYGESAVWVRPASMWNETVTRDGKTFRRFTKI